MTYKNKEARYAKKCAKNRVYNDIYTMYRNADSMDEFSVNLAASGLDTYHLEWRYKLKYLREDMPRFLFLVLAYIFTVFPIMSLLYGALWFCAASIDAFVATGVICMLGGIFLSYYIPLWIIDSATP